ncbi:unnamed protein product [Adineta steineri]|nr:unnamed protein product [Adineta steineri]
MIDQKMCPPMENKINLQWKKNGITIVGGNGQGDGLNQLHAPHGIYVDNDADSIYIADSENHRIIRWRFDADEGEIFADGNEQGSGMHQLNYPVDVVLDREKKYLIICDLRNIRVMQWSLQNSQDRLILIYPIREREVRRWRQGDKQGTIIAGEIGQGNQLNQLNQPKYIFVDEYHSIYVADGTNNRVMKWMKNATEGILIAPEQVSEENHSSMIEPIGIIVDPMSNIYVSSTGSHQITRWSPDAIEGFSVVGEKQSGSKSTQLRYPCDLSFDRHGNLYVVDRDNHRIQKFLIDLD